MKNENKLLRKKINVNSFNGLLVRGVTEAVWCMVEATKIMNRKFFYPFSFYLIVLATQLRGCWLRRCRDRRLVFIKHGFIYKFLYL